MPVTIAALLVLLVLVKSCQGIAYNYSNECKIYRLGYPIDEARLLAATLSDEQVDSLIAHQEHDTIAIPCWASATSSPTTSTATSPITRVDTTMPAQMSSSPWSTWDMTATGNPARCPATPARAN